MAWEQGAPREHKQRIKDGIVGGLEVLAGLGMAAGVARHAPEWYQHTEHPSPLAAIAVGTAAGLIMNGYQRFRNVRYVPEHQYDDGVKRMENTLRNNAHKLADYARRVEEMIAKYMQSRRESRKHGNVYTPQYAIA